MVTIEQKLNLFSKLLNQSLKEEMDKKFELLDKEYEKKMAEDKLKVDKEVKEIIQLAKKRAELNWQEEISQVKIANKRQVLELRKELIRAFMKKLEDKVTRFTTLPKYRLYLKSRLNAVKTILKSGEDLTIYLTESDYVAHKDFIYEQLALSEIHNITFKITNKKILGGMIIEDVALNIRLDESMYAIIEDQQDKIIDKVLKRIQKGGGL